MRRRENIVTQARAGDRAARKKRVSARGKVKGQGAPPTNRDGGEIPHKEE